MYFWNFASENPPKNLAYDEALLEIIESREAPSPGVLRVWEMPVHSVVLGRSSQADRESNRSACEQSGVPILRRCSGGATILAGSGCLMYSVVLSFNQLPQVSTIDGAHDYILERLLLAIQHCGVQAQRAGICDLVFGSTKFSGNALRLKRTSVLYHGTILYSMNISQVDRLLGYPAREPTYRQGRSHGEFIGNISVSKGALIRELRDAFDAQEDWGLFPDRLEVESKAEELLRERYIQPQWNFAR